MSSIRMETYKLNRDDERVRERKRIAKKLKGYNIFADEFISETVGLPVATIKRLKAVR